jgi:N-acetylglucosamine-6-sulfatase
MALDDSVGAVVSELEQRNLLNDTLVVYMSDNGFQFGEHGLIDKRTMYETSIRIPMIAHCPDLFAPNRDVNGMALNIDIGPTMLDAAGAPPLPNAHGRSLVPLLAAGSRTPEDWRKDFVYEYFWERDFPQTPTVVGLRTNQYAFMQYHGIWDIDELYDIQSDFDEMNNLLANVRMTTESGRNFQRIKDPELKQRIGGFQSRIHEILAATNGRPEPSWKR